MAGNTSQEVKQRMRISSDGACLYVSDGPIRCYVTCYAATPQRRGRGTRNQHGCCLMCGVCVRGADGSLQYTHTHVHMERESYEYEQGECVQSRGKRPQFASGPCSPPLCLCFFISPLFSPPNGVPLLLFLFSAPSSSLCCVLTNEKMASISSSSSFSKRNETNNSLFLSFLFFYKVVHFWCCCFAQAKIKVALKESKSFLVLRPRDTHANENTARRHLHRRFLHGIKTDARRGSGKKERAERRAARSDCNQIPRQQLEIRRNTLRVVCVYVCRESTTG